mgnify:CR=1 FL=1
MLFSARLLLIAAIAFAEFYIPFVELSKIALSFVVFNVVFRGYVLANSAFFVVFCLGNPALPQTTSTDALLCTNSGKEKRGTVLSERIFFKIVPAYFFVLKKSLVFKFFVNLHP